MLQGNGERVGRLRGAARRDVIFWNLQLDDLLADAAVDFSLLSVGFALHRESSVGTCEPQTGSSIGADCKAFYTLLAPCAEQSSLIDGPSPRGPRASGGAAAAMGMPPEPAQAGQFAVALYGCWQHYDEGTPAFS